MVTLWIHPREWEVANLDKWVTQLNILLRTTWSLSAQVQTSCLEVQLCHLLDLFISYKRVYILFYFYVFLLSSLKHTNETIFFFWKMTHSKQYLINYFCILFGIQVRVTLPSISKWTKVSSGDFSQFICGREGVRIGLRSRRRPCRLSMTRCVEKRTEKRYKTREWKDSFVLLCFCRWCYTVL